MFVSHKGRVGVWVAGAAGDTHTAEKLCPRASRPQGEESPWGCGHLLVLKPCCSCGRQGEGHGGTLSSSSLDNEVVLQLSLVGLHGHWGPKFRNWRCDCALGGGGGEERREGKSTSASSRFRCRAFNTYHAACGPDSKAGVGVAAGARGPLCESFLSALCWPMTTERNRELVSVLSSSRSWKRETEKPTESQNSSAVVTFLGWRAQVATKMN